MSTIRILEPTVANQIAAGEVVERPAAVIKELLENSLDAGARRVTVDFSRGGKARMIVEDDGKGMTGDEALLSLERHATSKIQLASDLDRIATFGFRGEALPSIASVARFTMQTRPASAPSGTEIAINGGKLVHRRDHGMAPGTRIEVANLFHPVPARLKFLKSDETEAAHIVRLVRLYAIAHPEVGFLLREDGREIFRSPGNAPLLDRVREIWGRQVAEEVTIMPAFERPGMRLSGLLGKPGVSRGTRQDLVTVVNGRPVDSRTMAFALTESYHTLIPKGRYPLAFVFLEMDPAWVDVNVHPAKREVRFRDEAKVRNFLIESVLAVLRARADDGLPAETIPATAPATPPSAVITTVTTLAGTTFSSSRRRLRPSGRFTSISAASKGRSSRARRAAATVFTAVTSAFSASRKPARRRRSNASSSSSKTLRPASGDFGMARDCAVGRARLQPKPLVSGRRPSRQPAR